MTESDSHPDGEKKYSAKTPADSTDKPPRWSLFGGVKARLRRIGDGMVSRVVSKLLDVPATPEGEEDGEQPAGASTGEQGNKRRVGVLHEVSQKLRGAADGYVAAKLDEIEARVDVKLDQIDHRIDAKIMQFHKQITALRDRELRHRLRLLKITLAITLLVALLSLGYKWVLRTWF